MIQRGDFLLDSTFPILQHEEHDFFSIAGTSVLVRHREVEFLVTAAHVLRDNGGANPLIMCFEKENIELVGPAWMTPQTENNDLDVAIFDLRFHAKLRELFDGYRVHSLEEPDELPGYARSHYYIFGYPFRKAKYKRDSGEIKISPLDYITDEVEDDIYAKYGTNKEENILVRYEPKNTYDSNKISKIAPYPHGASGGPIFRILVDDEDHAIMFIFEGVMTRWKDKKYILSTRKSQIKSFIDKRFF
ncbi:hypothetical protein WH367_19465 [Comamonas sp. MYb21]|uniref:hypothetical protein n=1 Tax=Comamonas sp. MYb21 TaxID=1848648 RepID=UPI0030B1A8F8